MNEIKNPEYLKIDIFIVIHNHPEWGTKEGATGQCIAASDELLFERNRLTDAVINGCIGGDPTSLGCSRRDMC